MLALLIEGCIQSQSGSGHPDPIHVTSHYLKAATPSPFTIRVRKVRNGRLFTNITADLYQQGTLVITTHQIFGVNSPGCSSTQPSGLTIIPPSRYARRIPLYTHPSKVVARPMSPVWRCQMHFDLAIDPHMLAKNAIDHPTRSSPPTIGGDGLEWGAWFTFKDKNDKITNPSLAFLVDIFPNTPILIPRSERPKIGESWFPTIVLSIEFKAPIPHFSEKDASRSIGVYTVGKFMNDGRHDEYTEIWTAPCNIGDGKETSDWREHQVCLATSTQMAYVVPMENNLQKEKNRETKL